MMTGGRKRKTDWAALLRLVVAAVALASIGFLLGMLVPRTGAVVGAELPPPTPSFSASPTTFPTQTLACIVEAPAPTPSVRYAISDAERDLVERVVMAEAGGEDFDGQALVAQCVLNTAEARDMRPDAVVLEKRQYAPTAEAATQEVKEAVAAVFDDGYIVTGEPVRFFYAPKRCYSSWHENKLEFVLEHGGHRFFKEAGA